MSASLLLIFSATTQNAHRLCAAISLHNNADAASGRRPHSARCRLARLHVTAEYDRSACDDGACGLDSRGPARGPANC